MARAADTPSSGSPFAKFNQVGQTLIGAFGGGKSRQQIDFKKKEPKWKDEEKTKMLLEEVMWFVAMPGTTAFTGDPESPNTITPGDVVRYAVGGFKWGQVIEQRRALPEHAGFKAGQSCSGDVYTITLAGWSIDTDNAAGAQKAGFTVTDGRIVIRTLEQKNQYVLMRSSKNQPTTLGNDFDIRIRRTTAEHKAWEQQADALFDSKPWEGETAPAMAGAPATTTYADDEEPF